jgi:hypothetical protein
MELWPDKKHDEQGELEQLNLFHLKIKLLAFQIVQQLLEKYKFTRIQVDPSDLIYNPFIALSL